MNRRNFILSATVAPFLKRFVPSGAWNGVTIPAMDFSRAQAENALIARYASDILCCSKYDSSFSDQSRFMEWKEFEFEDPPFGWSNKA